MSRIVFHVDMDAFFASVEERDHPEFVGMPIVVGADPMEGAGRGVVSTANYKARKYGVGSAMSISKAWHLCLEGERGGGQPCIFFGGMHEKYKKESERVMDIVRQFAERFESVGIDEMYFEAGVETFEAASNLAKEVRRQIQKETHLTASVGIGPNKLIAKIASDFNKPDGLTVVGPDFVGEFLAPLPIRRIPGVGPKAAAILNARGVKTVYDARRFTEQELFALFGRWGKDMYRRVLGIDERQLETSHDRKSLGHEVTFMEDESDPNTIVQTIKLLSEQVGEEVFGLGLLARRVTLRVRFDDFSTVTRQATLDVPTDDGIIIEKEALKLLLPFLDLRGNPERRRFRLLGVRVARLTVEQPLDI